MEYEFKKGDKLRRKDDSTQSLAVGDIAELLEDVSTDDYHHYARMRVDKSGIEDLWNIGKFDLVTPASNSKSLQKTMEKKVYNVLVIDKKTGKTDKNLVVTAENEQSAILKAFGVDVENVFIKITEEGSYQEEKPVTAVLVKETKTPKGQ